MERKATRQGPRQGLQPGQTGLLEGGVVVGIEVIEPHHSLAALEQRLGDGGADEAGGAGEEGDHGEVGSGQASDSPWSAQTRPKSR